MEQIDCENISDLATAEAAQLSEHLVTDSLLCVTVTLADTHTHTLSQSVRGWWLSEPTPADSTYS